VLTYIAVGAAQSVHDCCGSVIGM